MEVGEDDDRDGAACGPRTGLFPTGMRYVLVSGLSSSSAAAGAFQFSAATVA
ncbi:MAG: hypothetical protein U0235_12115 [Polyangiaceae bacterium]